MNNVQIIGEPVEGNTIRGVGEYFGGREGPSKYEWLREDKDTGLVYISLLLALLQTMTSVTDLTDFFFFLVRTLLFHWFIKFCGTRIWVYTHSEGV